MSLEKPTDEFHDGVKTYFDLGNNNVLSILKSKNNPNAVIYELQNPNGCKLYLEKLDNRATLLSVDDTGKRRYISCRSTFLFSNSVANYKR
ncbi:unnamed protein product [Onchocerca flexuosa]|uniref:S9 family peptidase n=1 Tax=Onchocerca flexuosa TaxID=387005 RepID=A0A183HJH9_9BILA|nr:unnamed protein product [Onchocerca flexuosa]